MIASEVRRAYRTSGTTADRPATGAFGTGRSTDEPVAAQHERAQETGRGRHAQAPWQIPWRGWKDILWRTYEQVGEDRLLAVAAGVVFYGLLAVFPAVTALVSLYGLLRGTAGLLLALIHLRRPAIPPTALSSCSASLMLVPFGLVATFDPGVTLLPAMYSPTNGTDHRKLDSG